MRSRIESQILRHVFLALIVAGGAIALLRSAEKPAADPTPASDPLAGVWVHVGEPGNVTAAPRAGGRFKFRIDGRWTYTSADPATGHVKAHFGGKYQLRGNEYFETIDYSTDPDDPELGNALKFTVKIEGDLMTQTGVGNPYTEVWRRVR